MNIKKENFLQQIKKNNLLQQNSKIIIAFSGGPDSVALLHLLYSVKNYFNLELTAIYIDHNLRKCLKEDYEIIEYIKKQYPQINVIVEKIEVEEFSQINHKSTVKAARILRYETLNK